MIGFTTTHGDKATIIKHHVLKRHIPELPNSTKRRPRPCRRQLSRTLAAGLLGSSTGLEGAGAFEDAAPAGANLYAESLAKWKTLPGPSENEGVSFLSTSGETQGMWQKIAQSGDPHTFLIKGTPL